MAVCFTMWSFLCGWSYVNGIFNSLKEQTSLTRLRTHHYSLEHPRIQAYSTLYSQAVIHRRTVQVRCYLIWVIAREPVLQRYASVSLIGIIIIPAIFFPFLFFSFEIQRKIAYVYVPPENGSRLKDELAHYRTICTTFYINIQLQDLVRRLMYTFREISMPNGAHGEFKETETLKFKEHISFRCFSF